MEAFESIKLFFDLTRASWRFLKWPIALWVYFVVSIGTLGLGLLLILAVFVLSYLALAEDRRRESAGNDDFRGTGLFYRYGKQISYKTVSIPLQRESDAGKALRVAGELRDGIAQRVAHRLPGAAEVLSPLEIKDRDAPNEGGKDLVRVRSVSHRGSLLVHFLHYAPLGQSVTAHHFIFLRGTHKPFDEFRFVFFSPFTIWMWGLPWVQNRFSILSHLSMAVSNSFDEIDLQTLFEATSSVIVAATEAVLRENGLLTEELHQLIVNNHYNNQRLDLRQASNFRLGSVTNLAVPAAAN
jgi:hypothetical protein